LAVRQLQQIARAVECEFIRRHAHIDFIRLAAHGVVAVKHHIADLIGVAGRGGYIERVTPLLDAVIRVAPG